MGTSKTKGESGLYKHLKEIAQFLVERKKIKAVPNLYDAIDPGPMEKYLGSK